jgi:hypothetical protein
MVISNERFICGGNRCTCHTINPAGKYVVKDCVVSLAGDTIEVVESSGVGASIEWMVEASDASGNASSAECGLTVANPGKVRRSKSTFCGGGLPGEALWVSFARTDVPGG